MNDRKDLLEIVPLAYQLFIQLEVMVSVDIFNVGPMDTSPIAFAVTTVNASAIRVLPIARGILPPLLRSLNLSSTS